MRLTLRTLLAYLDDILEPAQAKEIGQKLNESSLASSLVSRIREVMRRRRLTAPTLSGPGVGIDPNTVAEYLDNTLAPDGVADVEKICLESDVHLAEVAACHQVLTLALGEPVEVPQKTRERMYALGPSATKVTPVMLAPRASSDELPSEALQDVLNQAEALARRPVPAAVPARHQPAAASAPQTVPDYLKTRSSWKKILGYTVAAAALVVWAVLAFQNSPLGTGTTPKRAEESSQKIAAAEKAEPADKSAETAQPLDIAAVDASKKLPAERPQVPSDEPTRSAPPARIPRETASIDLPQPADEVDDQEPPFRRKTPAEPVETEPGDESEVASATDVPQEKTATEKPPVGADVKPAVPATPPARYASPDGVTLHYMRSDERWFVLPRRAVVHPGDLLAVPDPFEGTFELENHQAVVTLRGRTAVRWLGPTDAAPTGLEVRRGQVVIRTLGSSGEKGEPLHFGLLLGGDLWTLEVAPGSTCGVDMQPREPTKFEQEPAKGDYLGGIYVTSGETTVTDPLGKSTLIKGPGWLRLPSGPTPQLLTIPVWMKPQNPTVTERQYARNFEKKFNLDESVDLWLPAVAEDPNFLLSRMATDCLGLIESYGPLVQILQRQSPNSHDESRRSAITSLRLWLPRAPENRELLRAELAKLYPPEDAEAAYRLLWGFDADDARNKDTSQQLLDWMAHPDVSIRELAFYHVYRLTDKTHDYRPSAKPLQLQTALNRWKQHIAKEGALLAPLKDDAK